MEWFYRYSAISTVVFTLILFILWAPFLLLPFGFLIDAISLSHLFVSFRRNHLVHQFFEEFRNALDVRAVNSGLPLNDDIHLTVSESL